MSTTKSNLIEAATGLFLARSYGAVGMVELCRAAGVNKGTLYHFFPSKAALLAAAIADYADEFAGSFAAIAESDRAPLAKIVALFGVPERANFDWQAAHGHAQGCLVGNMTLEVSMDEPEVRAATLAAFAKWKAAIGPILVECRTAQGPMECRSDAAIDVDADRIIGLIQGGLLLAKAYNDPAHIGAMAPVALAMMSAPGTPTCLPL